MTIVVGLSTPDGLVLASDSRTTFYSGERHRVISDNAQKLFPLPGLAVAAAGNVFIGQRTIAGTMDQFVARSKGRAHDYDRALHALADFCNQSFNDYLKSTNQTWNVEEQGYPIDLLVAGYDSDGIGHIREVLIPGPVIGEFQITTTEGGTMWRGQTDVIGRLLNGVDLVELGLVGDPLTDELRSRLDGLAYNTLTPIAVQDAVDYATFLIRTTIDMQRFSDGTVAHPGLVPACGGPIHALVVERQSIRWASPSSRPGWSEAAG